MKVCWLSGFLIECSFLITCDATSVEKRLEGDGGLWINGCTYSCDGWI